MLFLIEIEAREFLFKLRKNELLAQQIQLVMRIKDDSIHFFSAKTVRGQLIVSVLFFSNSDVEVAARNVC